MCSAVFFEFEKCYNMGWEWSGEAETGSKSSDRLSESFGMVLGKIIIETTKKINDFPCFSVDFPGFSRITRGSDNQGFPRHRKSWNISHFAIRIRWESAAHCSNECHQNDPELIPK